MVAAAVVGAGVLGAGATAYAGNQAASAQESAANQANQTEQGFFNTANQNLQPFIQAGTNATNEIQQLEGIPTAPTYNTAAYQNALTAYNAAQPSGNNSPAAQAAASLWYQQAAGGIPSGPPPGSPAFEALYSTSNGASSGSGASAPTLSQFQTSPGSPGGATGIMATLQGLPGYQFANTQGLESVTNSNTARGLGLSGAQLKGAANYSTGLANQYYNNLLTGLQNTANTGAGSAASLTGAATSLGSSIGQNTIGAGNAAAAGDIATSNAVGSAASSVPTGLIASSLLQNLGNTNAGTTNFLAGTGSNPADFSVAPNAANYATLSGAAQNPLINFGS